MSDRFKYATNGIYKCENFAQQVEANDFESISIGIVAGYNSWSLKYRIEIVDGQSFLSLKLRCCRQKKVRIRTFFNALRKDGSSGSMRRENYWTWNYKPHNFPNKLFVLPELLDPQNGYLDDGLLSMEYGFQIDAIFGYDDIWKFHFKDTVFNYTGEENQMVRCTHKIVLQYRLKFYCSAEILNFHCPQFVRQAEKFVSHYTINPDNVFDCLQILHGVRIKLETYNYFNILKTARSFNLSNVIHYCDRAYFEGWDKYWRINSLNFQDVVNYHLRHILAEKLKNLDWKDLVKIAKELNFKEASGEVMKTFVAKILYN